MSDNGPSRGFAPPCRFSTFTLRFSGAQIPPESRSETNGEVQDKHSVIEGTAVRYVERPSGQIAHAMWIYAHLIFGFTEWSHENQTLTKLPG
jgi:hypothetical protein